MPKLCIDNTSKQGGFMKIKLIKLSLIIISFAISSISFASGENSLIFKLGSYSLATSNQTIVSPVTFDTDSSSVFSLEYERQFGNDVSWGGELISYSNTYSSGAGKADSTHVLFNIKKYIVVSANVKPFFGVGLGGSSVTLGGIGTGSGGGLGFQAMAGIKFPLDAISLILEYKFISAKPDDVVGTSVDISGGGFFAGIALNF